MRVSKSAAKMIWLGLAGVVVLLTVLFTHSGVNDAGDGTTSITSNFSGTPTIPGDGNTNMRKQTADNVFSLPFSSVTTSGLTQVDASTQVVDPDATLTFEIPAGTYDEPFSTVGSKNYSQITNFGLVFSLGGGNYIDGTSDAVSYSTSADGSGALSKTKGYLPIASYNDYSSELYRSDDSDWWGDTTSSLTLRKDLYIHVDLSKTGYSDTVQNLTISEQFGINFDSVSYYKVAMGQLNFQVNLSPTVDSTLILPTPVTYKGQTVAAIVIGSGTIPGDSMLYAINSDATLDSANMQSSDGSYVTVNSQKKWVWLVPESVGLKGGDKLSVTEKRRDVDTSNTDTGDLVDNSKYLAAGGGDGLVDDLDQLVKTYIDGADPVTLQEITDKLKEINDTVTEEKQIETDTAESHASIKFDNDADFIFTPEYADQNITIPGIANYPSDSRNVTLMDDETNQKYSENEIKSTSWSVCKTGTSDPITDGAPTIGNVEKNSVTIEANDETGKYINSFDDGVDVVAKVTMTDGTVIRVRKHLSIIALQPEHADKGDWGTSQTLKLTTVPSSFSSSNISGVKWYLNPKRGFPNNELQWPTSTDFTCDTGELTYVNDGDTYQVAFTFNGQLYYSNVVQVVIDQPQDTTLYDAPDLNFTDNGSSASLSKIISGSYNEDNQLTAEGNSMFAFGSHNGATNWTLSATMTPFQNADDGQTIGDSSGGEATLTANFKMYDGSDTDVAGITSPTDSDGDLTGSLLDDNQPTTLYSGTSTGNFTLYGKLTSKLKLAKTPAARQGDYSSTITWTTGSGPIIPAAK